MDHETNTTAVMSSTLRLFRAYPGSGKADQATIRDYCQKLAKYPAGFVDRAIDGLLTGSAGGQRNSEFVPSIETISKHVQSMKMTDTEEATYRSLHGYPPAIEHKPEPETRRYTPEQVRSTQAEVARRLADNPSMAERALEDTPLGRRLARLRTEHAGRPVLATGVSLEAFKRGAAKHEFGVGATYVPLLETVYGARGSR